MGKNVKGGEGMSTKSRIIEEYEVNPHTMVLKPIEYGAKTFTQIIEVNDVLISPFKPLEILKKSCEYFGSSYEGLKEGTKTLTGIVYKAPIIVNPQMSLFFFPTTSPAKHECTWISHAFVKEYEPLEDGSTNVHLQNQQTCIVPISYSSFKNQMRKTAELRIAYSQRISEMETRYGLGAPEPSQVKMFFLDRDIPKQDA